MSGTRPQIQPKMLLVALLLLQLFGCSGSDELERTIRFGVSPFQDTYLPVVGEHLGWYDDVGLDVEFRVLGWTEAIEALTAGQVDLIINNMSSVIGSHPRNPDLVYWYGINTFDNGFALMIRPDGPMQPLDAFLSGASSREEAVSLAASQLRGRTVVTTGSTDMEQGVAAAARRGGLDFLRDVRVIDLNPDEGLAAFLRGEGDAFIGGIPQRVRAGREGMIEMLTGIDLGPAPINGIVTTRTFAEENEETLFRILEVWFRIVGYIDEDIDRGAGLVVGDLNRLTGAGFTVEDFRRIWNNYEHFPSDPAEIYDEILSPDGRNFWRARWDDTNHYFVEVKGLAVGRVEAEDAFMMPGVHDRYLAWSAARAAGQR